MMFEGRNGVFYTGYFAGATVVVVCTLLGSFWLTLVLAILLCATARHFAVERWFKDGTL
jgi:hypothetical protein